MKKKEKKKTKRKKKEKDSCLSLSQGVLKMLGKNNITIWKDKLYYIIDENTQRKYKELKP